MTSTRRFRHNHGFAPPHHLRQGLLVVFDGLAGSGKTDQLVRIREVQDRLFHVPPVFVELPADVHSPQAEGERGRALGALNEGRTVFAERWVYEDAIPDLVLLSLTSFTSAAPGPMPWMDVPADRRAVLPEGHQGVVGVELWTAMARRGYYASCLCQVTS